MFAHLDLTFVTGRQHDLRRRELHIVQAGVDKSLSSQHSVSEFRKNTMTTYCSPFHFRLRTPRTNQCVYTYLSVEELTLRPVVKRLTRHLFTHVHVTILFRPFYIPLDEFLVHIMKILSTKF